MSITHTQSATWSDGGTSLSSVYSVVNANEANDSIAIPALGTVTKDFAYIANEQSNSFIMLSGGVAGDTAILTTYAALKGAQGAALDTITLVNGIAAQWGGSGPSTLQKVTDVKSIKLVSSSAAPTQLDIRIGLSG